MSKVTIIIADAIIVLLLAVAIAIGCSKTPVVDYDVAVNIPKTYRIVCSENPSLCVITNVQ